MSKKKTLLFAAAAVLLSVALSIFVIGEFFFRLTHSFTPVINMGISMGRPDPVFHHLYPPDIQVKEMFAGFPTSFSTNKEGLRGKDYPKDKPQGVYRILVLGDSFVFGTAVNDDQTFCRLLEDSLNAKAEGRRFEVLNCGVVSYSPILEYIILKRKLLDYSPDLVMLFYNFPDLQEDALYARHAVYDKNGEAIACNPFYIDNHPDYVLFLREHFRLFSYLYNKLSDSFRKIGILGLKDYMLCSMKGISAKEMIMRRPTIKSVQIDAYFIFRDNVEDKVIRYYWKGSKAWLDKIKALLDKQGVDFILAGFPHGLQISKSAWNEGRASWYFQKDRLYDPAAPFKMLEDYSRQENVKFLDLRPYLSAHADEQLYYDFDGHWTFLGHKRVAEAVLGDRLFNETIRR